ncbi:unnamed protein product [Lactuca saligna]|uniref:Uncharacterized protein n=1 Tax=Lactuca saligna TaxID=75948 RepID=A0AA36E625_LACSI|nr:unnamed protein product [Lactuca saligna]
MIFKPFVVVFFGILICTVDIIYATNLESKLFDIDVAIARSVEGQIKAARIQMQDSETKLRQISGSLKMKVENILGKLTAARMQIQDAESQLGQISGSMEEDEEIPSEKVVGMFSDDIRNNQDRQLNNGAGRGGTSTFDSEGPII